MACSSLIEGSFRYVPLDEHVLTEVLTAVLSMLPWMLFLLNIAHILL
jgi:hypothetical protein